MKNLKTVGKVVALTALVATQANAWEVPGWSWAQENIVNPVSQKGSDALNFVKDIQWRDKVEQIGLEEGWDATGDGEYVEKAVTKTIPGVFSTVGNGLKSFAKGAKHYTYDQCTKENGKKLVDGTKAVCKNAQVWMEENPKASIAVGAAVIGSIAAIFYVVARKVNKTRAKNGQPVVETEEEQPEEEWYEHEMYQFNQ